MNVLGLMSRTHQLHSYVSTQSITSEVVIACIDAFFRTVNKRTVIVVDQASIHTSGAIYDKLALSGKTEALRFSSCRATHRN